MSFSRDPRADRPSDAPLSVETTGSTSLPLPNVFGDGLMGQLVARIPPQYLGLTGYLAAGIVLGLVLILAMSLGRNPSDDASGAASAAIAQPAANAITDNVTRLHAREIGATCWQGVEKDGPARLTVSVEIGVDGRVRYAAAAGESAAMRSCVEAHVRGWEFLPQAQVTAMALPVEVDRH
jgi:hypothetical protein